MQPTLPKSKSRKPRRGRPPRADKAATERIEIRVTKLERAHLEHEAARAGVSISEFMRQRITALGVTPREAGLRAVQMLRDGYVPPSNPNRLWPCETWDDAIGALERWCKP